MVFTLLGNSLTSYLVYVETTFTPHWKNSGVETNIRIYLLSTNTESGPGSLLARQININPTRAKKVYKA